MWVKQLSLQQFRLFKQVQWQLSAGVNLIVGENGSGKTTLLEAIALLSRAKSPKTSQDKELIQHQQDHCFVQLSAESTTRGELVLSAGISAPFMGNPPDEEEPIRKSLQTKFKFQDKPLRSRTQLVGKLPTVTFFTQDLRLLRGDPEDRRQLVDAAIAQIDPQHLEHLKHYQQLKQQKSALLKQFQVSPQPGLLQTYNSQLAQLAGQIVHGRLAYLKMIGSDVQQGYAQLASEQEYSLALGYQGTFVQQLLQAELPTVDTLTTRAAEAIERRFQDEIRREQVLVGPHRDDIVFELSGEDASKFASQGQQRSIVLAFKMAELLALKAHCLGESPVVLLDDVMAELDAKRQQALLSLFTLDTQVLMTTTHVEDHLPQLYQLVQDHTINPIKIWQVQHGQILAAEKIPEHPLA